jgi:predicted XRE-type DNA-binding protein
MARKKVASVFQDLYLADQAAEMEIRAQLLRGLTDWQKASGLTQLQAAKALGITQARVSDLHQGKINRFSLDVLVRLAAQTQAGCLGAVNALGPTQELPD